VLLLKQPNIKVVMDYKYNEKLEYMNNISTQTRLIDLTVEDLLSIIDERLTKNSTDTQKSSNELKYGIAGIQEIFKCSRVKAQEIKNSGIINKAIVQLGRKIIINPAVALEEAHKNQLKF